MNRSLFVVLSLSSAFAFAACGDDDDLIPTNPGTGASGGTGGTGGTPGTGGTGGTPGTGGTGGTPGTGGTGGTGGGPSACAPNCPEQIVAADITTSTTWTSDKTWVLQQLINVTAGATLTIEPGTVVKGSPSPSGPTSALIVGKGSRLVAVGTAQAPIVFTSGKANRVPGDWGGVVLCGNARVNNPVSDPVNTIAIEGLPDEDRYICGGGDDADNSGSLSYVRIEFAGYKIEPNTELNGLGLYGVGSGTTLDHIQVHLGSDDGIEWFGGTASMKYAVVTGALDDSFDWGYGFRGNVQYGLVLQDDLGSSGNGIEADNINSGQAETEGDPALVSNPTLANITLIGSAQVAGDGKSGALFRRRTNALLTRSVICGFSKANTGVGVTVDGAGAIANATAGTLNVTESRFCANPDNFAATAGGMPSPQPGDDWLVVGGRNNVELGGNPFELIALSQLQSLSVFAQMAGSPLLGAPNASPVPSNPYFIANDFYGACGTSCAEFEGWTAFPQQ
jgi:hypothetical protein